MIRNGLAIVSSLAAIILTVIGCGGGSSPAIVDTDISGLDNRPANSTCIAPERPSSSSSFTTTRVFNNLQFMMPVGMLQAPSDNSRWYILEQAGVVRVFDNDPNTQTTATFLDISTRVSSGGERGLLGMAFHPDYTSNAQVFISYTTTVNSQLVSRISRFFTTDGGQTLDDSSEEILLTVAQPFSNHNGGHIAFGPDKYL